MQGLEEKTVLSIPWKCVLYLSALEMFPVEVLYKSTSPLPLPRETYVGETVWLKWKTTERQHWSFINIPANTALHSQADLSSSHFPSCDWRHWPSRPPAIGGLIKSVWTPPSMEVMGCAVWHGHGTGVMQWPSPAMRLWRRRSWWTCSCISIR